VTAPRMTSHEAMALAPHETGHRAYELATNIIYDQLVAAGDLFCIRCGENWPCLAYRDAHTCLCSHLESLHHATRHGQAMCAPASCGCAQLRLKGEASR
jgi:hypothetical protein